jgi:hypothetical protein
MRRLLLARLPQAAGRDAGDRAAWGAVIQAAGIRAE